MGEDDYAYLYYGMMFDASEFKETVHAYLNSSSDTIASDEEGDDDDHYSLETLTNLLKFSVPVKMEDSFAIYSQEDYCNKIFIWFHGFGANTYVSEFGYDQLTDDQLLKPSQRDLDALDKDLERIGLKGIAKSSYSWFFISRRT